MAREIIWTPEAEKTLSQIVDFLEREWTEKEIQKFLVKIESTIQLIKNQPTVFRSISRKYAIHEALVTKHNVLIYQVKSDTIMLIIFWDTRRNPKKKPIR